MKTLTVKVPDALNSKLASLARRRHTSRSVIVREALEQYGSHTALSFTEAAADLCGTLHGPADLASNPEHLEGYGV